MTDGGSNREVDLVKIVKTISDAENRKDPKNESGYIDNSGNSVKFDERLRR